MANYPSQLRERDELNLRLGIKSSLSQLRSVIASLYVIYVANDKQAQVTYSKESINGSLTSIKLEDNLAQQIDAKFPTAAEKISSLVNKTPLFTAQLEALQVGIELFFHLAKINFVASGLSERTGSSRFQKKLAFATNMILVDLYLSSHSNEDVNKLLAAWLEDKPFASKLEDGLKMLLNTFTEETQYKIRDNNLDEIVFIKVLFISDQQIFDLESRHFPDDGHILTVAHHNKNVFQLIVVVNFKVMATRDLLGVRFRFRETQYIRFFDRHVVFGCRDHFSV